MSIRERQRERRTIAFLIKPVYNMEHKKTQGESSECSEKEANVSLFERGPQ